MAIVFSIIYLLVLVYCILLSKRFVEAVEKIAAKFEGPGKS